MANPNGATHYSTYGTFYKKQGKFWFVYHKGAGWKAISGEPVYTLYKVGTSEQV